MNENRILLNETTFTKLCKMGYFTTNDNNDLYFTKEDIKTLTSGKVVEKETGYTQTKCLFLLQDIGMELIIGIVKRSPIYTDLADILIQNI